MKKSSMLNSGVLGILAVLVSFASSPVLAAPSVDLPPKHVPEIAGDKLDQRCARIEQQVTKKISKFDSTRARHGAAYDNLVKRLQKISAQAKEKDVDTTKLDGYITQLEDLIVTFKADYASYQTKMKAVPSLACTRKSTGEQMKTLLKPAKDMLGTLRKDAAAIRKLYKEKIRPEVQSIKSVMQQQV